MRESSSNVASFRLDREGRIAASSAGALELFGSRAAEALGRHVGALYPTEAMQAEAPHRALAVASEHGHHLDDTWLMRGDGTRFWANVTIACVRDDRGALVGFTVVVRDLTPQLHDDARHRIDARHAAERAALEAVFVHAPACICVLRGPDHVFELANPGYRALLGGRDVTGLPVREAVPELASQGYLELLDRVYRTGEPFLGKNMVTRIDRPDGTSVETVFDFVYQPIRGADGNCDGILAFGFDVTEQAVARRRLEEARTIAERRAARLRHVVESSPFAVAMLDCELRYLFASERWIAEHGLGLTGEELRGRRHGDVFPGLAPRWHELLARALAGEDFQNDEEPLVRPDGGVAWLRWAIRPWTDDGGSIGGLLLFTEDVSGKKRAADDLRGLLDASPFAVVMYEGPEHVATYSNPRHDELTDGRVKLGRPLVESLPELAGTPTLAIMDEVLRTGGTRSEQEMYIPLVVDGELEDRWFDVTWQAVRSRPGAVDAVFVTAIPVSEHVAARRRLELARRVTDTITSNASLGLLLMDERQHCTFMNPAAEAITGFRLDEVQGAPLHDFIHHTHPDGRPYPMAECPIDRALPTQNQQRGEDVFIHKDGHFYPVAFTASPLREGGRPIGTVIELRDTTDEKRAQQERERMLADLREAVMARDEFLAVASHELKTPLTPLQLQLDAIKGALGRAGVASEAIAGKLQQATRQTERLRTLVEKLLDVWHVTSGRFGLELDRVDLGALVSGVADLFADDARRAGSPIAVEVERGVVGHWDRVRLEQVIGNLVSNAIKYGRGHPIAVQLRTHGATASLTVRDHGIGVADADRARIFERFERGVSLRHYGGLGLGLFITRQIVEAHGGTIRVDATPGAGSTFTVELPMTLPAAGS